ncbi:cytochrome c oxidase subunit III [Hymenobacter sp. BT175]|uniref:cytochrome c oxidase subunit 3 n=1 Tax=Hymenobacter translucens TaxID=2886507 RepID=UPI001D0E479B|nr:cytochrome c oxidase subunit III [Hymenobacter translucens]MCC2544979.1 cytochrome c oxidase subunit III [Hymenobacter translucens]
MNSDKEHKDKVGAGHPASAFTRIERVPPLMMLLYLSMVGITVLFVILVAAYAQTRYYSSLPSGLHPFPRYFSLSTIVLLVSSYTLSQAPRLYKEDDVSGLVRCLGATLLLGITFIGLQLLGWRELVQQGIFFSGEASGTYVYIISALHVTHLLGGIVFLTLLLMHSLHASRDAVRTLVFIRNPFRMRQLRMLGLYWHYIDGLWIALFAVFLFLY